MRGKGHLSCAAASPCRGKVTRIVGRPNEGHRLDATGQSHRKCSCYVGSVPPSRPFCRYEGANSVAVARMVKVTGFVRRSRVVERSPELLPLRHRASEQEAERGFERRLRGQSHK